LRPPHSLPSSVPAPAQLPPPRGAAWSVAAPNAAFASYHTFAFGLAETPPPAYKTTPRSLEVQRRLHSVVLATLQQRGYVEDSSKSDFIVKLVTGTGDGTNAVERADLQIEGYRRPAPAQGFIGVDIYDAASGTMIWQSSAFAEVDPAKIDDTLLQRGVDHMLADFPPGHSTASASAK
jgi:Domain of unknown function (DUF4136)